MRAAELFNQAVVAAAGDQCALGAQLIGDKLERGVTIIIEPAHEVRGEFVGHSGSIEPGADRREEALGLSSQCHRWRAGREWLVPRVLAVEDPQRVIVEPGLAVLT